MKFIEFIHDPINGFFALVGAVILSMFGAFIKDGILKILSRSSKWLKEKREKELKLRDLIVERLVNSQPYLILYCTTTIISNISVVLILMIVISIQSYLKLADFIVTPVQSATNNISTFILNYPIGLIVYYAVLIFLILACIIGLALLYSISQRNLIIVRATKMIQASINLRSNKHILGAEKSSLSNPAHTSTRSDASNESTSPSITIHPKSSDTGRADEDRAKDTRLDDNNFAFVKHITKDGRRYVARKGKLFIVRHDNKKNE